MSTSLIFHFKCGSQTETENIIFFFLRNSYSTELELTVIIQLMNVTPPPQPHCKGFCSGIYQPLCSFVFLTGEKRSCQCTQGNMANLQKYKASKKDRSCKSKKTSTKILASYSPVSTISHSLPSCLGSSGSQCSHSREKNKTEKKRCHVRARKTLFGILVIPQMKS